ncbi:MAG: hypothetical protein H8E98_01120, partial [Bacteroidetes bacterium]|nr:hypothetical protein [Bacteroidota bacterium]
MNYFIGKDQAKLYIDNIPSIETSEYNFKRWYDSSPKHYKTYKDFIDTMVSYFHNNSQFRYIIRKNHKKYASVESLLLATKTLSITKGEDGKLINYTDRHIEVYSFVSYIHKLKPGHHITRPMPTNVFISEHVLRRFFEYDLLKNNRADSELTYKNIFYLGFFIQSYFERNFDINNITSKSFYIPSLDGVIIGNILIKFEFDDDNKIADYNIYAKLNTFVPNYKLNKYKDQTDIVENIETFLNKHSKRINNYVEGLLMCSVECDKKKNPAA